MISSSSATVWRRSWRDLSLLVSVTDLSTAATHSPVDCRPSDVRNPNPNPNLSTLGNPVCCLTDIHNADVVMCCWWRWRCQWLWLSGQASGATVRDTADTGHTAAVSTGTRCQGPVSRLWRRWVTWLTQTDKYKRPKIYILTLSLFTSC